MAIFYLLSIGKQVPARSPAICVGGYSTDEQVRIMAF